LIGMEACGSAHYWARKLAELGHTTRLMAAQFVKPPAGDGREAPVDQKVQSNL
jgi:transposase